MADSDTTSGNSGAPTNEALIAAIHAYDDGPERDRNTVLRHLLNARLLLPLSKTPDPDSKVLDVACTRINAEGEQGLVAFTDYESLGRANLPEGGVNFWATATLLARLVIVNDYFGLVLNPDGPARFAIDIGEASAIAEGALPPDAGRIHVPYGTKLKITDPDERPPDAVLDELRRAVELARVETAYWCEVTIDDGPPHFAVSFAPYNDKIVRAVKPAVESVVTRYRPLSPRYFLVPLDGTDYLSNLSTPNTATTFRSIVEAHGERLLLYQEGHVGYPRFVRSEDTADGWHSFHPDPRLLPAPTPSNDVLSDAIIAGYRNQADDEAIYAAVLGSRLIVPVYCPSDARPAPSCVQLAYVSPFGERCLAGATDETSFCRAFAKESAWWVVLRGEDLCRIALDGRYSGVTLYAGEGINYTLSLLACDALSRARLPSRDGQENLEAGGYISFGMPRSRPPEALLEGLRRAADDAGAEEVYWVFMFRGKEPIHMGLAIRPYTREIAGSLGNAATALIEQFKGVTPYVDFLDLEASPGPRDHGVLLYRRGKKSGFWRRR